MKKIMLCSLTALVAWGMVVDGCWAVDKVITDPNYIGDGTWIFAPGKAVRCGTRDEHVQNQHYVTKFGGYNNNQEHEFQTRKCLAHGNDQFIKADTPKCGSGKYWCVDMSKAYELCSPINDMITLSSDYNVYESAGHMCWDCIKGYSTPDKDYTIPSAQCTGSVCKITTRMCVPDDMVNCFKAAAAGQPANWNGTSCNCGSVDGIIYTWKNGKCVKTNSTDDKNKPDDNNNQKDDKKKKDGGNDISCKQSRTTEEGKACCDLASAVAKWDGQHCNCTGGKQFKIVNGRGTCTINETCETKYAGNNEAIACCNLSKTTGEATWVEGMNRCVCNDESKTWDKKTFTCVDGGASNPVVPVSECRYTLNIDIQCKNGNHFSKNASVKLTNEQVTAAQCDTLKQNMQSIENMLKSTKNEVSTYAEIIKTVCGDNSTSILPYSEVDLKAARETLKSFFANANKNASVWKTEEGNFNGARLASDLTAGVVLGTVGGVVSSKVIKKKQIEKGFEVLHCTIGGQTAADWGDTFTVGLN